mgnify:CR=1 FL=1
MLKKKRIFGAGLDVFDKEGEHLRNITQTFAEWLDELTPSPNPQIIEPVNDFL